MADSGAVMQEDIAEAQRVATSVTDGPFVPSIDGVVPDTSAKALDSTTQEMVRAQIHRDAITHYYNMYHIVLPISACVSLTQQHDGRPACAKPAPCRRLLCAALACTQVPRHIRFQNPQSTAQAHRLAGQ